MIRRFFVGFGSTLLLLSLGCTRHSSSPQLVVDVPSGFSGNFVLNMGVHGASPLDKDGTSYVVRVPQSGKIETSTLLEKADVHFSNGTSGRIWGFSQIMFTTGDGISIGGKIEFFVGTRQEFEAEQNKKNKSGRFTGANPSLAVRPETEGRQPGAAAPRTST